MKKDETRNADEDMLSILFNEAPDAIFLSSLGGVIIEANEQAEHMTGLPKEQLVGNNFFKLGLMSKTDIIRGLSSFKNLLTKGKFGPERYTLQRRDGKQLRIELGAHLVNYKGKKVVLGISRDITEISQKEEELERSESEKRAILDSSPDPLFVSTDTQFLYINKSGAQVLRIQNPEELIGKPLSYVIPPSARISIERLVKDKLEGKPVPEKYDIPIPVGDDKFLNMEANIRVIDFEGTPAVITSMRDITRLKQYQERLKVLHRHAVELDNAVTTKDIVDFTGRVMTDTLNYEHIDVITVKDDYLHDSYPRYSDFKSHISDKGIVTRAARTQETQFVPDTSLDEDYMEGAHSSTQRSEISVPVISQGITVAVLNIESKEPNAFSLQDKELLETLASHISSAFDRINQVDRLERQVLERTEQLIEMDHARTLFVRTAAHELRTPVTVIQGFLEIISQDYLDNLPENVVKMLEAVERNTQRLTSLTNDLLDLQRLEAGSLSLNLETGNVNNLILVACDELGTHLGDDRLEYCLNLGEIPDSSFDLNRISQVIVNLILNAIKFTPEKGVICISSRVEENWIIVQVRDSGIGLSPDDIWRLFRTFPGIEHGLKVSSTGLGLSISKGIVELHGGEIWAESEGIGKGSTFSFKIPVK